MVPAGSYPPRGHDDASSYQIERDSRVGTLSDSLKRVLLDWQQGHYDVGVV